MKIIGRAALVTSILFIASWIGLAAPALAQAPPNDNCSGAVPIPVSPAAGPFVIVTGTNVGATSSSPPVALPSCGTYAGGDIWFQSVVGASGALALAESGDSLWSTETAAAYVGTCGGGLVEVGCQATALTATTTATVSCLAPGTTVYWRLFDFGNDDFGPINVYVFDPITGAVPANDCCSNATLLTVGAGATTFVMNGASDDGGVSCDASANFGVWFRFVAPASGAVNVVATSALEVAIFDTCGGNELGGCDITAVSAQFTCLVPGVEYRILAWEDTTTFLASYSITLTSATVTTPANDCCAAPTPLTVHPAGGCPGLATTFSMVGATDDGGTSCDASANIGVWFSFIGPPSGVVNASATSTREFALFDGCNGNEIACDTTAVASTFFVTPGAPYRLLVFEDTAPTGSDTICLEEGPPPPPNDNCASAITVGCGSVVSGSTATASPTTTGLATCEGSAGASPDVWYVAIGTGSRMVASTCGFTGTGSITDTIVNVYTGSCATGLLCATGDDDSCDAPANQSIASWATVAGVPYLIRVQAFAAATTGTFELSITCPTCGNGVLELGEQCDDGNAIAGDGCDPTCGIEPPPNDECIGATPIPVTGPCAASPVTGTNFGATDSSPTSGIPPGACSFEGGDIWFSTVVPASGSVTLGVASSPYSTTNVTAYTGTCASLTVIGGTCTNIQTTPKTITGLTAGTVVFWRLWDGLNDAFGPVTLVASDGTTPPAPSNDNCSGSVPLLGVAADEAACSPTFVCTLGATPSLGTTGCGTTAANDDVWYRFIAPSTGGVQIRAENIVGGASIGVGLYSSCVPTEVYCDIATLGTAPAPDYSDPITGLIPGNTYFLRMWVAGTTGGGRFDVCVIKLPGPPLNDDCAGALPVPVALTQAACTATPVDTLTATQSLPAPSCATTATDDDVWYSFTAPPSGRVQVQTDNFTGTAVTGIAIYEACGGTQVACDAASAGTPDVSPAFGGLTPGATYLLRIWNTSTTVGGSFDLCVFQPPPPPPNDECSGAIGVSVAPNQAACVSTPVSTLNAGQSLPNPSCTSTGNEDDVWFSFTAPASGRVQVEYENFVGGTAAAGTALYDACLGTEVACDAGSLGTAPAPDLSDIFSGLTPGATYILRTWNTNTITAGTYDMCVFQIPPPPANDTICGAVPLGCGDRVFGSTTFAIPDTAPTCTTTTGTGGAVWYRYTGVPGGGCVTLTTCNLGTNYDTKISVYTTAGNTCLEGLVDPDSLECVVGNDDQSPTCTFNTNDSTVNFVASPFRNYWIMVHGLGTAVGDFELSVSCQAPPPNDDACSPTFALVGASTPYDNQCAGPSELTPGPGTGAVPCDSQDGWCVADPFTQKDVWFEFFMPGSGSVSVMADNTTGSSDTQVAVWTATDCSDPSTFVEVAANDDGGPGLEGRAVVVCGVPGTQYLVQVDVYNPTGINPPDSAGNLIITDLGGLLPRVDIPFECATYFTTGDFDLDTTVHLNAFGFGGPLGFGQGFTYSWSPSAGIVNSSCDDSTISVEPDVDTVYTVTVTDSRGCTATDSVTVHVVDATADCSNNPDNIHKLQLCHVPPGNPENAHDVCIDQHALFAHLPGGMGHDTCLLGPCGACRNNGTAPAPTPTACTAELVDDFDPTIDADKWETLVSAQADDLCGAETSPNGLLFDGPVPRQAVMSLVFGPGSALTFDVMHPTALVTPCELPDAGDELHVEWSLDGETWNRIGTVASGSTPVFTEKCFALPDEAVCGEGTLVRFFQIGTSTSFEPATGNSFDQWIVDNVEITCLPEPPPLPPCTAEDIDDFDPAVDLTAWTAIQNGTASGSVAGTGCGSSPPASGNTLYFNGPTGSQRFAESLPSDLVAGSAIQFDIRIPRALEASPCEDLDTATESVELQVSGTSGACTASSGWETIAVFGPDFGLGLWTTTTTPVPAHLQGADVSFRIIQDTHSGAAFDNWAIDNVRIVCAP